MIYKDEMKVFYKENGVYHREDGPAIEWNNGDKEWQINGKRHRTDGPAVENAVCNFWYKNGKRHREDGAAVEYYNVVPNIESYKEFWLDDKKYSEEEYYRVIKLLFLI